MATALNTPNLYEEVKKKRCPEGTAIPSVHWQKLQFWPRNVGKFTSRRYTGHIKVKYMIMARQFREEHVDCHMRQQFGDMTENFVFDFQPTQNLFVKMTNMWLKSENLVIQLPRLIVENKSLSALVRHIKFLIMISPSFHLLFL